MTEEKTARKKAGKGATVRGWAGEYHHPKCAPRHVGISCDVDECVFKMRKRTHSQLRKLWPGLSQRFKIAEEER